MCKCCGLDPLDLTTVEAVAALTYDTLSVYGALGQGSRGSFLEAPEVIRKGYEELVVFILEKPTADAWDLYEHLQRHDMAAGLVVNSDPYFLLSADVQDYYRLIKAVMVAALRNIGVA